MDRYLFNTEIRFPLYARFGGVIFYDLGLFDNPNDKTKYGWNTGFGLTFNTGLGPVRVDTAYKNQLVNLIYFFHCFTCFRMSDSTLILYI